MIIAQGRGEWSPSARTEPTPWVKRTKELFPSPREERWSMKGDCVFPGFYPLSIPAGTSEERDKRERVFSFDRSVTNILNYSMPKTNQRCFRQRARLPVYFISCGLAAPCLSSHIRLRDTTYERNGDRDADSYQGWPQFLWLGPGQRRTQGWRIGGFSSGGRSHHQQRWRGHGQRRVGHDGLFRQGRARGFRRAEAGS